MDSMLSAIRAKRNSSGMDKNEMMHESKEGESGMQDLVSSLDDNQKQELLKLLVNSQSPEDSGQSAMEIEKGGPSPREKKIIDQKAQSESMEMGAEDPEQSDAIAMSMIDKNSLQKAEAGVRPRGLGDRAKMMAAQKLKEKGLVK